VRKLQQRYFYLICLVVIAVGLSAYVPALSGSLYLDDFSSLQRFIDSNGEKSFRMLYDMVSVESSGFTGRPASMWTFAVQAYFGFATSFGFKVTNLVLHCIVGVSVGLYFYELTKSLGVGGKCQSAPPVLLALLVCALWTILAIHSSTVMYSVQRMAILSTLFMLISLISYEKARAFEVARRMRFFWLVAMVIFFILAVYSKENALILPLVIIARELFSRPVPLITPKVPLFLGSATVIFVVVHLSLVYVGQQWFSDYSLRDFNSGERLATQYVALYEMLMRTVLPTAELLGIYQDDFPKALSVFDSSQSVLSALLVFGIFLFASYSLLYLRFRLLGFSAAAFLILHLPESTVVPLELYFEHRNYAPSIFFVFAVILLLTNRLRKKVVWVALLSFSSLQILRLSEVSALMGHQVLYANHVAASKPESARALTILAELHADAGNIDKALALSDRIRSIKQESSVDSLLRNFLYMCASGVEVPGEFYSELVVAPGELEYPRYVVSISKQLRLGVCEEHEVALLLDALDERFLGREELFEASTLYHVLASLSGQLSRFDQALAYIDFAIDYDPKNLPVLYTKGELLLVSGRHESLRLWLTLLNQFEPVTYAQKDALERYTAIVRREVGVAEGANL
jgi:tetratricopeptide (TPR) repeat protein